MTRHMMTPAVYGLLIRDRKILLMRRANTGYGDGMYTLPGGHVEDGEKLVDALTREIKEELNLSVKSRDLSLCHTMRRYIPGNDRIDFFYETLLWAGNLYNNEPKKCDQIIWVFPHDLPENTLPHIKEFLKHYSHVTLFSEFWESGNS